MPNIKETISQTKQRDYTLNYRTLSYISSGNCKLGRIDHAYRIAEDKNQQQLFRHIIKQTNLHIYHVHTISEKDVNWFKKNFEVLSITTIPIGYSVHGAGSRQYHLMLKNPNRKLYNNRIFKAQGVQIEAYGGAKVDSLAPKFSQSVNALLNAFKAGRKDKSYHATTGFKKWLNNE